MGAGGGGGVAKMCESQNYFLKKLQWNSVKTTKTIKDQFWWLYKWKKTEHNPKWAHTLDHPYRILIIGGSGSGKKKHD